MDRRRFLGYAALAAGAVGAAVGAAATAAAGDAAATAAPVALRLGDTAAADSPQVAAEQVFAQRLAAQTGGRYAVSLHPAAALGDHHRLIEQVRAGSLTMTRVRITDLAVLDRRLGVFALPYLADQAALLAALAGQLGAAVAAGLAAADLTVLTFLDAGTRNLATVRRPVHGPGDLRGARLWVPGQPALGEAVAALGAEPVPLAPGAVAGALRAGRLDGVERDTGQHQTDLAAAAPVVSLTRHRVDVDVLLAGRRWWQALAPGDRDAVALAAAEAAAQQRRLVAGRADKFAAQLAATGATAVDDVDVAAFRAALRPVHDRYRSAAGDVGRLLP